MKRILIVWVVLTMAAWAMPPEFEWLLRLPGVHKMMINNWGTAGWEANLTMDGDGQATTEKIRIWMMKQGWKVKDDDHSSSGVTSRRLDGVRGTQKFNVTATQQKGQQGRLNAALIGK